MRKRFYPRTLIALGLATVPLVILLLFQLLEHLATSSSAGRVLRADKFEIDVSWASVVGLLASVFFSFTVLPPANANVRRITPVVLFSVLYLTMVYPGILFTLGPLSNGTRAICVYALATVMFALGVRLARRNCAGGSIRPLHSPEPSYFGRLPIRVLSAGKHSAAGWWCAGILVVSVAWVVTTGGLDRVVSYQAIRDFLVDGEVSSSASRVSDARQNVYLERRGAAFVLNNYLVNLIIPVSALALLGLGLQGQKGLRVSAGLVGLLFSFAFLMGTGSRLAVARLFLLVIVWSSWTGLGTTRRAFTLAVAAMTVLVLSTVTLGRMADQGNILNNIVGASNRLFERIALTKGCVTGDVFDVVPGVLDYQMGATIVTKMSGLAGDESLAQILFFHRHGKQGTAGPQAFGELYVNWGIAGVAIGAFVLGMIVQRVSDWMSRQPLLDPVCLAMISYAVVAISYWGYGDLSAPKTLGIHVLAVYFVLYQCWRSVVSAHIANQAPINPRLLRAYLAGST